MAVCARCGTENPEASKFCGECGAALAAPAPREQRKTVTVLFCDVSGSTALGERVDPEALRGIMSRYFEVARTAIERHGGTVEKFIGDAVMAVFGVPVAHEDDALRAVRAAVELRDAVEVDVRIGVNTGEVVTGGQDTLATGDAVNVAARLEQAAARGEVLVGHATYALVREAVDAELLPPLEVKGKSLPLTAYRIRSIAREPGRRDAAPMIGRAGELELLARAYERSVRERACHLFTVLGTAGIGKSRLVAEFLRGLGGARVVYGRCLSYGEGITYWPVVSVLKELGGSPDDPAVRVPVAALLGESDVATTPPEIAWAVRKTFEHASLDVPLVVVFDDIQWGEPAFLDLIEHVADLSRGAPILLLCMARPELLDLRPGWAGGKLNATSVLLEPLPREETETLVRALFGDAGDELVARIREAADGNPLFVEEMVELARASGGGVEVPPTIHALLTARLDSLPAAERAVLERGAVEGQVFHRNAVVALSPEEPHVDTRLVSLVRKELVRPDQPALPADDAYRFRHLLIRDAAYDALPKATRIELHARFATWLEEHGAHLVELDEIVGYHLEQAVRYAEELGRAENGHRRRAGRRLAAAARRADARGDANAARSLGTRAVALLAVEDQDRLDALLVLGKAAYESGFLEESLAAYGEIVARADGAVAARARAQTARVRAHGMSVPFEESYAEVERALVELGESTDDVALADVHLARAQILYYAGHNVAGREAAALAYGYARRSGDGVVEGLAAESYVTAMTWSDTPWEEVERFLRERLEEQRFGPRTAGRIFGGLSRCAWARGDFAEARELLAESHRRLVDLGQHMLEAAHWMVDADLERTAEDWGAMERAARIGWDRLGALGEAGFRSTAGMLLAEALVRLGRPDEAAAVLHEAETLTSPDDYVSVYLALGVRALLAGRRGDHEAAAPLARQSVDVADASDAVDHRLSAAVTAAEVLCAAGLGGEAEQLAARVLPLAERKGSLTLAARLRAAAAPAARQ
ncbi:MAG TPA: adenylate/guanylate cyclase domain-containing protein [Gaiellaceae bacterium]|nr:adenylate/guanylate cyclase domain-containing protein [Gaiellaceae bacterium]